jgi:hypothetical protein
MLIIGKDIAKVKIFKKKLIKIVGLTGYVHRMREGGKPVVVLLDVLMLSVFLLAKEEARYRRPTGMYRSRKRRMLLF